MGTVIPIHGDPHETTQKLLPWYVTRTLEPVEAAQVEAHLADCDMCRDELASEQRLRTALAGLPPAAEGHWASLRARALASERSPPPHWSRWGLIAAGQAAVLLVGIGAYDQLRAPGYEALADAAAPARAGNLIVMFRPDLREAALRGALAAVGARIVDGPTAAGGYVLAVPEGRRADVLTRLRGRQDVVLAQPIDPVAP